MADSRNRGNDRRLYVPPAQRQRQQQKQRQQQQQQKQQQQMMLVEREREQREREAIFHQFQQHQQQQQQLQMMMRMQYEEKRRQWLAQQMMMMKFEEAEMGLRRSEVVAPAAVEVLAKEEKIHTNIERLVETVTPHVPAHFIPQPRRNGKEVHGGGDVMLYYNLEDLWECYKEWSAYGAGVDLLLSGNEDITQYFVPFLSIIQLYVDPTRARKHGVDIISQKVSQLSMTQIPISRSRESLDSKGKLIFQYQEQDPPHQRKPFFDKISEFADIKKLRSCDILPSSWISVAWYPIYRIPTGPSLKSLEASFLTFHHLSTSGRSVVGATSSSKLPLPVFGLASYKLTSPNLLLTENDQKLCESLFQSANNWIERLEVYHPDFNFFLRNRQGTRH